MNELMYFETKKIGEPIVVAPDFFVENTMTFPKLTSTGEEFIKTLCEQYSNNEISAENFLEKIQSVANNYSGYVSEVYDKLYFSAINLLS